MTATFEDRWSAFAHVEEGDMPGTQMSRKGWNLEPTVTEEEARALTEEIRAAVEDVWMLLVRAHETKAWKALGYERWADYISGEFHKSRRWSYQLLDQAEVIAEIEAAAGITDVQSIAQIDGKTARDIKPLLSEVTEQIRDRIGRGEEPEEAVRDTVSIARNAVRGDGTTAAIGAVANRLKKRPSEEVLGRALGTLKAAVVALSDFEFNEIGDVDHWVKEIDETTKRLRKIRSQLLGG